MAAAVAAVARVMMRVRAAPRSSRRRLPGHPLYLPISPHISPTSRLHLRHISPTSRPHLVQAAPAGVLLAKFVHHVDPEVIDLRALNLPSRTEAELGRAERPQNHTRP